MADNVCWNCKWASWQMTAHATPRVRKNMNGTCGYPMERIALPNSVTGRTLYKSAIWYQNVTPCRVWEKK